jgi:hypothetical protein
MNWHEKMLHIDRRWIYLILGVAVIIPAVVGFHVPVNVTPEVKRVYDFVENLQVGDRIFISIDYDPASLAELHPMTYAILDQCFRKGLKPVVCTLSQFGAGMAEQALADIASKYHKQSGVDYCYLGYKPYPAITIMLMGVDFRVPFPQDYYGNPIDSIPMMDGVHNFNHVSGVIDLTSGNTADFWIIYGYGRYFMPLALGVTGVMAADYYPYLQSGQIFGLITGIKGAAEYEALAEYKGEGLKSIPYQTTSHVVILAFIIISNIGYFASRRSKE